MKIKQYFLCLALLLVSATGFTSNGYYDDDDDLKDHSRWQEKLPDNQRIKSISIPGTHDTGSVHFGVAVETQSLSITQQLKAGIRFMDIRLMDIRLMQSLNGLMVTHGPIAQLKNFEDVLGDVTDFLKKNPSEFILMRVNIRKGNPPFSIGFNSESKDESLRRYLTNPKYENFLYKGADHNPHISDVRGKLVLLNDHVNSGVGIPYNDFDIQDRYEVLPPFEKKRNYIKLHLEKAQESLSNIINYLSGVGPGLKALSITPADVAEQINEWAEIEILRSYKSKYIGIIVADFPGEGLIEAVINTNGMLKAQLFEHAYLRGEKKEIEIGDNIADLGDFASRISSIKVPAGYVVEAYQGKNFTGTRKVFADYTGWLDDFNDTISSVKFHRKGVKKIASNTELGELSSVGDNGFQTLFAEYRQLEITTQDGDWASTFSLPSAADSGTKVTFKGFASWSSTIYFNSESVQLVQGHDIELIYNGSEWTYQTTFKRPASLKDLKEGQVYNFRLQANAAGEMCGFQWTGGKLQKGGKTNAKFDCSDAGDTMLLSLTSSPYVHTDDSVILSGYILIMPGRNVCGLQWTGGDVDSHNERNAKFDCLGYRDKISITSANGGFSNLKILTKNGSCGLQIAGGAKDKHGERNAKFDCSGAWDKMTIADLSINKPVKDLNPSQTGRDESLNRNKPPQVCAYQYSHYQGKKRCYSVGTSANLWKNDNSFNDQISSVKVPSGLKVTLFNHDSLRGPSLELTENTAFLDNFDNITSALKVSKNSRRSLTKRTLNTAAKNY